MANTSLFGRDGIASKRKPKWWRSFGFIAFLAAILGLVSLVLAPIIFVIGMISVIGIPIALIAVVFPTLCLATVIAYLVFRIRPNWTFFGVARSYFIALLIMLTIPQIHNAEVRSAVAVLSSGDNGAAIVPLSRQDNLVVMATGRSPAKCYQTCLDLLLSGQIATFVTSNFNRGATTPDGNEKAIVHRFVRAPVCANEMALPKNKTHNEDKSGTVSFQLKAAAERGICLQSTSTSLSDIDAFRMVAHFDRRDLDYPKTSVLIDTMISPSRVAVYEKQIGGTIVPIAQQTNIRYSLLKPLLAYSISGGLISSTSSSWWRKNVSADYLSLDDLLSEKMGARLRRD